MCPERTPRCIGRGSWIRTNDLQYPKLPRYQAALYPDLLENRRYTLDASPARPVPLRPAPLLLSGLEQRVGYPIAGRDPVFLGCTTDYFEHALGQPSRRDDPGRERLRVLRNSQDPAIGPDEDHVERDVGVLHPHRHLLLRGKIEQHTLPLGKLLPVHQPGSLFFFRGRYLDREDVHA